ncbi:SHOCT domain-containing protein [Clostridium beijerinckii]|uniref:SHOCT domain-containing protein n=1 Tax=Clostridium beijerinckii TaxID=1520 RepID=UPI00232F8547|nr:SHOCT domain-containing protein [Clostridium beijerinckii]
MMGYGYNMMGIWNGMMIIPILLIAAIIYVIAKQEEKSYVKVCRVSDNSLNILKERFVRGEITEDEFYRIKNILNNKQ